MHTLGLQLAPILAAEKSKVPFYVAGGLLVAWALIVSLGLGLRRPRFPGGPGGERAVIAITTVLVLAAISTAVVTAGGSSTAGAEGSSKPATATSTESAPAPAAPAQPSGPSRAPATGAGTAAPAAPATRGSATSLKLAANPGGLLSFDTKQLSARAGTVTIAFTNSSPVEHNVAVAQGATVAGTTPTFTGATKTLTLNLKAGTYTFYCTVPGHRQAGMEGTLKIS